MISSSALSPASRIAPVTRRLRWFGGWRGDPAALSVAVLVIGAPARFTQNGFAPDYTNHLWLVGVQMRAIDAHGLPTYLLNSDQFGVFFPFFMFYGGTFYAIGGELAVLLGRATPSPFS